MEIREATGADAAGLVAYWRELAVEPGSNIPLTLDQVRGVDHQREVIEKFAASPRSLMLLALAAGDIVGELSLTAASSRPHATHIAVLGMSVRVAYRRRGAGRALVARAVEWAPTAGFKRIELWVYARNEAAIRLYESAAFVHEGRRRGAVREADAYLDDLLMARWLE